MVAKIAFVSLALNFKSLDVIERCIEQDVTGNCIYVIELFNVSIMVHNSYFQTLE